MKLIRVAIKNTYDTFLHDKRVFLLVILCTAITTFGFLFFFSYIAQYYQEYYCENLRAVTIDVREYKDSEQIYSSIMALNKEEIEDVYCRNFALEGKLQGEYQQEVILPIVDRLR